MDIGPHQPLLPTIFMRYLLVTPFLVLALPSVAHAQAEKPVFSFENEAEIKDARLNHAVAALTDKGVTTGKQALQVTFQPPAMYPGYNFPIATPLDWTGYGAIAFDATNPGTEQVSFALRIDSAAGSDGKNNSRTGNGKVPPGKTVSFLMPFNVEPVSPDMSKIGGYTFMNPGAWAPFNNGHIVAINFFTVKPAVEKTLILDNMRLVPELPPVEQVYKNETKPLLSFETEADKALVGANSASTQVVSQGATQGKSALRMKFDPPATYPNVVFKLPAVSDFRGYGGLAVDITNPTDSAISFGLRMDSSASLGTTGNGARQGGASIGAGETVSYLFPFGVDASALGMRNLPGSGGFRSLGSGGTGEFDLGSIAAWQIFLVRPTASKELILDNVRLVPGQKQDFKKLVDQYGQYTRADWPGKIKSDADFAAQKVQEAADLKANPPLADRDQYGGWAKGPQLKATGFFRVEKYQDKWTFVDPEGRLFISLGPDTVGPSATTVLSGRENMFSGSPKDDPILARYIKPEKGESVDFLGANLERKYGPDFKKAWFDVSYDRLRSWGFNTIGAFSSWDSLNNGKVPYTATVWPAAGHARVATGSDVWRTMDDPFDPKFLSDVTSSARGMAAKIKNDPYFLGYFVGNEESWGYFKSGPRSQYTLIIGALKMKAEQSPAKRAFLAQMQEKYGDVAKLNTAWGTSFADWAALNEPITIKDPMSDVMLADFSVLLKSYATQYFKTVQTALKSVDPNHLYLGCRFAGYSPEILEGAAQYCDVLSFNIYRQSIDPKEFKVLDPIDKPVLVGEFHFGATDRGMFDGGLVPTGDQTQRGQGYINYIRSVLDHPKFVGAHWFQYVDEPTLGRAQDGENANIGFVSITDTPYPEIIKAARQVHAEMYTRRFGKQ